MQSPVLTITLIKDPEPNVEEQMVVPVTSAQPDPPAVTESTMLPEHTSKAEVAAPQPNVDAPVLSSPPTQVPDAELRESDRVLSSQTDVPNTSTNSASLVHVPKIFAHPAYRRNPEPIYPLSARRRRQEGTVLLDVRVDIRGRAVKVELKKTSGFPALDDAAATTVQNWDFEPARIGGKPIESQIEVPIRFQLTN